MWAYQLMSSRTACGVYSVSVIASSFAAGRRNGVRSTSKDVAPLPCTPASEPLTYTSARPYAPSQRRKTARSAQDSGTSNVRWNVATPSSGTSAVVDDVAGDPGRRPAARGVRGRGRARRRMPHSPSRSRRSAARRKLAQAACEVARVQP